MRAWEERVSYVYGIESIGLYVLLYYNNHILYYYQYLYYTGMHAGPSYTIRYITSYIGLGFLRPHP